MKHNKSDMVVVNILDIPYTTYSFTQQISMIDVYSFKLHTGETIGVNHTYCVACEA